MEELLELKNGEYTTKLFNNKNVALAMLESLKNLHYNRKFSKDEIAEIKLQLSRELYIEVFVHLAQEAGYNRRRLMRLAHEANRSFDRSLAPKEVDKYVAEILGKEKEIYTYNDLAELFDMSDEEYNEFIGSKIDELD